MDENTRLSAKIQREAGEDGLRSRCVGYDPETCTALFELNGNMEEGGKYQEQMRLRITQVRPQQYHEYTIETQPWRQPCRRTMRRQWSWKQGRWFCSPARRS